jgi:hypothetical protein
VDIVEALINGVSIPLIYNPGTGFYENTITTDVSGRLEVKITTIDAAGNTASEATFLRVVTLSDILAVNVLTDKAVHLPNEEVIIRAVVTDNNNLSISGASVRAEILQPGGTSFVLTLLNDGAHQDVEANDGVYANTFTPSLQGTYNVNVTAEKENMISASGSTTFVITEHDLAIIGGYYPAEQTRGKPVQIRVDIRNFGYISENTILELIDLTENQTIDSKPATISARSDKSVYLNWDTSNALLGTHNLNINLQPVLNPRISEVASV